MAPLSMKRPASTTMTKMGAASSCVMAVAFHVAERTDSVTSLFTL